MDPLREALVLLVGSALGEPFTDDQKNLLTELARILKAVIALRELGYEETMAHDIAAYEVATAAAAEGLTLASDPAETAAAVDTPASAV